MAEKGKNRKKGNGEEKGGNQLSVKRRKSFSEAEIVAKSNKTISPPSFVSKRARDSYKESDFGGGGDTRSDTDSVLLTGSEESVERNCPILVKSFVSTMSVEFDSDARDPEDLNLGNLESLENSQNLDNSGNSEKTPKKSKAKKRKRKGKGKEEGKEEGKDVCCSKEIDQKIEVQALKGTERVLEYLSKRVVQVKPILKYPNDENTALLTQSNTNRFTVHYSKVPRKTSVSQCTVMGKVVEVTTTNESVVVDSWLLENLGHICGEGSKESLKDDGCHVSSGSANVKKGSSRVDSNLKASISRDSRETATCVEERGERQEREGMSSGNGGEVLLGLDLEWKPNFSKRQDNKVAVLQLSNDTRCLLVQMLFLDSTPLHLKTVLCSPKVLLGGVGIEEDAYKLSRDHGIDCSNRIVNLNILAERKLQTADVRKVGLKQLTKVVLGESIAKSKSVTMSNWARESLSENQVQYAAIDAWVSGAILRELFNKHRIPC